MAFERTKAKALAAIYASLAAGDEWQQLIGDVWFPLSTTPNMDSDLSWWRKKPEDKAVDLQPLIHSGIDCEFGDAEDNLYFIGPLGGFSIDPDVVHRYNPCREQTNFKPQAKPFRYCRPRMHHWHFLEPGKGKPIPAGLLVEFITRDGTEHDRIDAHKLNWVASNQVYDIIAFKIVGVAEGFCWPWETETESP